MSKSNGLKSTIIENRVFYEKHADLFDPLDKATYENLKEAIAVAGHIISAIVVDEEGNIIDGIHRLRIANELHLRLDQINLQVVSGLTDEQRIEKAYELNLHRRQLSKEKQQAARLFRVKRVVAKKQEKKSSRVIARELGISQTQVLRYIEDAETLGLLPAKDQEEARDLHGTVHVYETPVSSCPGQVSGLHGTVHVYETPVSSCPGQVSGAESPGVTDVTPKKKKPSEKKKIPTAPTQEAGVQGCTPAPKPGQADINVLLSCYRDVCSRLQESKAHNLALCRSSTSEFRELDELVTKIQHVVNFMADSCRAEQVERSKGN